MREDMVERFSEPTRRYKRSKFPRRRKKVAHLDADGYPPVIGGMVRIHKAVDDYDHDRGYPSDYSVLRRFLTANRGRPWNEVYSEICAGADVRSHDGYRFRESVENLVCTSCEMGDDGNVYTKDSWGRVRAIGWWQSYYVHPETGLLEWVEKTGRKFREQEYPRTVFESDGKLYHQHEGIWYIVEMEPYSSSDWSNGIRPTDTFGVVGGYDQYYYNTYNALRRKYGYGPNKSLWYCTAKQSAGKSDIKKMKKQNNLG